MGNFNNDRSDRGRGNDNRGFERPQMHSATCSKCGKSCMVPFRPTGNRPIFCNECFKTEGASLPRRTDDRGPQMNTDRQMFDAICDKCGSRCQIPFQPRPGKQVFCSHCFEQKERGTVSTQERPRTNDEFTSLNAKLDKILELLNPQVKKVPANIPQKAVLEEKAIEAIEAIELPELKEVEEEIVKKAPAKKKAAPKKKASSK